MINIRFIWFKLKEFCTKTKFERQWLSLDSSFSFYEGVFIYHTKKNPNRKIHGALTLDSIENLKRHLSQRWPVRWWLQETLPTLIRHNLPGYYWPQRFREWRWKRKNPQHKIEPRGLKKSEYYEPSELVMHCIFEVIQRYYETEYPRYEFYLDTPDEEIEDINLEFARAARERARRLLECVKWWEEERPTMVEYIESMWDNVPKVGNGEMMPTALKKYRDTPQYNQYREWNKKRCELETALHIKDVAMTKLALEVVFETC